MVEALVTQYASAFSRDLGLQKIMLEEDVMEIVNAVKAKEKNWSNFGKLVDDIRRVLKTLQF